MNAEGYIAAREVLCVTPVTSVVELFVCRTMLAMIPPDLLAILVCPACKQPLEYRQNPETLKCTQCHRVYAVQDDIPDMLIDHATIEA